MESPEVVVITVRTFYMLKRILFDALIVYEWPQ